LVLLLEKEARLTLWEYLEDEHAGKLPFSVLRTPAWTLTATGEKLAPLPLRFLYSFDEGISNANELSRLRLFISSLSG
jgi:hypothetical protein